MGAWMAPLWLLLLLTRLPHKIDAHVNLFIASSEMNRTLGLPTELLYVAKGDVNAYATQFPLRVGTHVSHILLSWNASQPTHYSVRAETDTADVLPVVHLPPTGHIPSYTETFAVEYRCAGSRAGQFLVSLHFSILIAEKPLQFTLRQEKLCATLDGRRRYAPDGGIAVRNPEKSFALPNIIVQLVCGGGGVLALILVFWLAKWIFRQRRQKEAKNKCSADGGILRRSSSSCVGVQRNSMQTTFLTSTPKVNSERRISVFSGIENSNSNLNLNSNSNLNLNSNLNQNLNFNSNFNSNLNFNSSFNSNLNFNSNFNSNLNFNSNSNSNPNFPRIQFERSHRLDVKAALAELTADRHLFQILWTELEGTFGAVRWAVWSQTPLGLSGDVDEEEDGASEELAVVCKTLKPTADKSQFQHFIQTALAFHHVPTHPNLAQPVAAATYGDFAAPESVTDFPLLCYRHQGFGNLKKFLQNCREPQQETHQDTPALRTHELLSMGVQVVRAVQHLHNYGLLHKDVATRNCLVSELAHTAGGDRLYVQLADSALSADLFPLDYAYGHAHARAQTGEGVKPRALRWMAPECARTEIHSSATDVWSVGVTLWELFTSGQQPFEAFGDAEEVVEQVERGVRLGQPYCCPDDLYALMQACWATDPLERPTVAELRADLEQLLLQLNRFI